MEPGLVSVIIPTHNYAHFLPETLASVLAQEYQCREIIVVDDGSTDDTRQVLEPFRKDVCYLVQPNQGPAAARNNGIRSARGEYIALLDADDIWHPAKLRLQVQCLREHPEVSLAATELFLDRPQPWPAPDEQPRASPLVFSLEDVVLRTRFACSSVVVRKNCLDAVGLFDPTLRLVEDRDLWIRLASRWPVVKLPQPLLWCRPHPDSLSAHAGRMEAAERHVLQKAFAELPALHGRYLLRRKTFSQASFSSAQEFGASRQWWAAIWRVLRSLALWPLPFRRNDVDAPFTRMRSLCGLGLRLLGFGQTQRSPS
jgi:glycosyltransferase involved in cell wall biosynthesis